MKKSPGLQFPTINTFLKTPGFTISRDSLSQLAFSIKNKNKITQNINLRHILTVKRLVRD